MHEYFYIRFIEFMLAGQSFTDSKKIFSWNNFKKNNKVILKLYLTVSKTNNGRVMFFLSKYAVYTNKNLRFIYKKAKSSKLLGKLGIKTFLSKVPLICDIFL